LYADIGLPQKKSAGVGAGVGSQASPIPSVSVSFWSALAVVGQLSSAFGIPSPSVSGSTQVRSVGSQNGTANAK